MKPTNEVVATFNDLDKAQAAQLKLEQAGIPAQVVDESKLQRWVFLTKPLACDKVYVDLASLATARHLLEESDPRDHILCGEVRCPMCGSSRIHFPQFTRKSLMPTFFGVILTLCHYVNKSFYCEECQYAWPSIEPLRWRTDDPQWPVRDRKV